MLKVFTFVLLLAIAASPQSIRSTPDNTNSVAIVGGILVDVRGGEEIQNSLVIVRGERITQVGVLGRLEIPDDAQIIDARGKWILPGLINMHAHVSSEDSDDLPLELFLANGVTTIRDPGGYVAVARLLKGDVDSGRRIGPRLFFCGE